MTKASPQRKAATKMSKQTSTVASAIAGMPKRLLAGPLSHLLLPALVALFAYANTFHSPFVFDDISSIVDNPVVKDLSTFLSGGGYAYNPRRFAGYLTFALNYKFGGLNVTGYHLVNTAIHIFNSWLVYFFVRLTLRTPFFKGRNEERGTRNENTSNLESRTSNLVPLLAALLFVAHPIQTQAVTYIVQRLASLATFFYLLSLVFYVKARLALQDRLQVSDVKFQISDSPSSNLKPETANPSHSLTPFFFMALSLTSAILAMRTKEIAATLPIVVLLYEFSFFGASGRKKLLFLVPILLTLLIIPAGMLHAGKPLGEILSDVSEMARESRTISRRDYLLTQFSVIGTYIRLLFLPLNQNLDYDYPVYHALLTPRVFMSFLFLAALAGLAICLWRRSAGIRDQGSGISKETVVVPIPGPRSPVPEYRLMAFGILWFFITLSVESSIIPISDVIFEHRLYLPSVGAFISLATLGSLAFRRYPPRVVMTVTAALLVVLAAATWQRNLVWRDELVLWSDAAAKSPNKYRPRNNLGKALCVRGRIDEGIEELQAALRLKPDYDDALNNLGIAYSKKGWLDRAIEQFAAALRVNPGHAATHNNLGEAYCNKGLIDEAIEECRTALTLKPQFAEAHNNLGTAYLKKGRTDEAIEEYRTALTVKPNFAEAHNNLGAAYLEKGWTDKAIGEFQSARKIMPENGDIHNNLGVAYETKGWADRTGKGFGASAESATAHFMKAGDLISKGRLDEGIKEYEATLRLKPDFADAHNNLGVAYGMKGSVDKAIERLETAIRLKPDSSDFHFNLARAYGMKGLSARSDKERRLAEKIGKRGTGGS